MNMHKSISVAVVSTLMFCSIAARAGDGTSDMRREFETQLGRDFKGWYFVTIPFTGDEIGKVRLNEHESLLNKTPLVNMQTWFPQDMSDDKKAAIYNRVVEVREGGDLDFNSDQARKSGFSLGASFLFRVLGLDLKTDSARAVSVNIKAGDIKVRQILWEEFATKFNEHVFSPALYAALKQHDILMCFGEVTIDGYEATVTANRSSNFALTARLDALAKRTSAVKGKAPEPGKGGSSAATNTMDIQVTYDAQTGKGGLKVSDTSVSGTKSAEVTTGPKSNGKPGTGAKTDKPGAGTKAANTTGAGANSGTKRGAGTDAGDTSGASTNTTAGSDTGTQSGAGNAGDTTGSGTNGGAATDKSTTGQTSGAQTNTSGAPSENGGFNTGNQSKGIWKVKMPKEVVIAFLYKTLPKEAHDLTQSSLNPQVKLNRHAAPQLQPIGSAFAQSVQTTSYASRASDIAFLKRVEKHLKPKKLPGAKKRPHIKQ